jgi:hypothetical protein
MEQFELCELQRNRRVAALSVLTMDRHEELRRGGVVEVAGGLPAIGRIGTDAA